MSVRATSAQDIVIGAGDFYYRDDSGIWSPGGATAGDDVFDVTRTYYVPKINGVRGPIIGTDWISDEVAKLTLQFLEIGAGLLALLIPDAVSTGGTPPATVVGGGTGTLSAAIAQGQSAAIKVSSVTSLSVGDYIKAGAGTGYVEYRKVARVGTVGPSGTGIDVDFPFAYPHSSGDAFVEVNGDGSTIITSGPNRRLPTSAYRDFMLYVPGLDGRDTRFVIKKGIATGPAQFTASDTKESQPQLVIEGRIDPAAPYAQPWEIHKIPTYLAS
jgi:hypothetical protein